MSLDTASLLQRTRRYFLRDSAVGLGGIALSTLLHGKSSGGSIDPAQDPLAERRSHFAAKAKHVIYLHMTGSPPHLDLYDYKPELVKRTGEDCPESISRRASGSPSPPASPSCSARRARSRSTASAGMLAVRRHAATCTASPTRCASSSRCTPTSSTTPRPSCCSTPARPRSGRPSLGLLGDLRPGHREREPARLRRADLQRRAAQRRQELLRQRLSAVGLPGSAVPLARAIRCSTSPTPPAWTATCAAQTLDALRDLNELQAARTRPPRNAHPHRPVRTRLPHAGRRSPR